MPTTASIEYFLRKAAAATKTYEAKMKEAADLKAEYLARAAQPDMVPPRWRRLLFNAPVIPAIDEVAARVLARADRYRQEVIGDAAWARDEATMYTGLAQAEMQHEQLMQGSPYASI